MAAAADHHDRVAAAGASPDVMARMIAERMGKALG
jgi:tripartite-type tricarboxylate transporter receptor subunit TctC